MGVTELHIRKVEFRSTINLLFTKTIDEVMEQQYDECKTSKEYEM